MNIPFIEASAKTNENVDEIFFQLATLIQDKVSQDQLNNDGRGSLNVNKAAGAKAGCC